MRDLLACNTTSDCNLDGDRIIRECFENPAFSNLTFLCDCSVYFGWKGDNCDVESVVLWYHRIMASILLIWMFILLVLSLRVLLTNLYLEGFKGDNNFVTIICLLVSSIFLMVYQSFRLIGNLSPEGYEIVLYSILDFQVEQVEVKGMNVGIHFASAGILFGNFSALFLLFSWDEVAQTLSKYQSEKKESKFKRIRFWFRTFTATYFLCLLVAVVSGQLFASSLMMFILCLLSPIFYCFYSATFITSLDLLHQGTNASPVLKEAIRLIKITTIVITVSLIALLIQVMLMAVAFDSMQRETSHGEFHYNHFLRDGIVVTSLTIYTAITWYVNSVTPGAVVSELCPRICSIFKAWDAENLKIIPGSTNEYEKRA